MQERAIKIIMALITFAIILTVLAVCIGIPIQKSQGNTGLNPGHYEKSVDERDVSANFVTLQHIDDSHGKGIGSTPAIDLGIQQPGEIKVGEQNLEDIQFGEQNSEDVATMSSDGNKPVNLAMLKLPEPTTTHIPIGAAVSNLIHKSDIQEGGKAFTERAALVTPARRSDVHPDLFKAVETSESTSTVILTTRGSNIATEVISKKEQSIPPTQPEPTPVEPSNSSITESNNVVDPKSRNSNEINMPENLAEDVKSNLASIANSLDSMVQLLKGMQQKTDKMFENMTATMNGLFQNLPNLLAATPVPSPRDCTDIAAQGYNESSTYVINPEGAQSYRVYCDLHSEGGGWTVFQRRFDGSVNFYQSWQEYVSGFGKAFGEYWAGLELIHRLTLTGTWELLIQLEDFDGNLAFAHYASFRVGSPESNYRLYVGAYDGNAGDAMTEDNHNKEFSTFNKDNDERSWGNCAQYRKGAWWYGSCSAANLNGLYLGPKKVSDSGMYWRKWKNNYEVLRRSEMKMRRIL